MCNLLFNFQKYFTNRVNNVSGFKLEKSKMVVYFEVEILSLYGVYIYICADL